MGKKFFELSDEPGQAWDIYNHCGLRGNFVASTHAARLMIPRKSGLIVTISSPGAVKYIFNVLYGVQKEAVSQFIFNYTQTSTIRMTA